MPSLEEALAALVENDEGEETPAEAPSAAKPNSAIKAVRDHAKKLERELATAQKERDELRAYREERAAADNAAALTAAGLSPRQAEVFLKTGEAVTPEAVEAFRKEVLGITPAEGVEPPEEFRPTGIVGDRQPNTVTKKEFEEIMRNNSTRGWELLNSGKVNF